MLPALWDALDRLASALRERRRRASVAQLLTAIVHFGMPRSDAQALELAHRWRLLRVGANGGDPYTGQRAGEYNVRLYEAQRDDLDRLARLLREHEGVTGGRSLLLNAIVHYHLPADVGDAEQLIRSFELELLGEPTTSAAVGGGSG